jgi:aspartate ammonia-lyase
MARIAGRPWASMRLFSTVPKRIPLLVGEVRRERDTMGEVEVPGHRYWGAQTQRSLQNFPIGGEKEVMPEPVVRAFGVLKKCAAKVR